MNTEDLDLGALAELLVQLAQSGQWLALAVGLLVLLVMLLRVGLARGLATWFPQLAWFGTDRGGAVLAGLTGVAVVVGSGLLSGAKLTAGLFVSGLVAGAAAVGAYVMPKRVASPPDEARASEMADLASRLGRAERVADYYRGEVRRAADSSPPVVRALAKKLLSGEPEK